MNTLETNPSILNEPHNYMNYGNPTITNDRVVKQPKNKVKQTKKDPQFTAQYKDFTPQPIFYKGLKNTKAQTHTKDRYQPHFEVRRTNPLTTMNVLVNPNHNLNQQGEEFRDNVIEIDSDKQQNPSLKIQEKTNNWNYIRNNANTLSRAYYNSLNAVNKN